MSAYDDAVLALQQMADGDARDQSYLDSVFSLSIERIRRSGRPCRLLVMTVGTQAYSVALSLVRSPAQRVVAVCTDKSAPSLAEGRGLAGLPADVDIVTRIVSAADSAGVYREIRDAVAGDTADVVIDFTSGTKAMTAAASAAAGYLGVRQVYLESAPLWKGSRYFGHEVPHEVEHPLAVFGDPKREEAERLAARGAYDAAERVFAELERSRVPDFHFEARRLLCVGYREMEALRFSEASTALFAAADLLARASRRNVSREPLVHLQGRISKQAEAARRLLEAVGSMSGPATDSMQANALCRFLVSYARRRRQTEPDLACLLYYRAGELSLQRRLVVAGYSAGKFSASEEFWRSYNIACEPDHRATEDNRPTKLGLAQVFTALRALEDPVIDGCFRNPMELLGKVNARNESIYAHGFRTLVGNNQAEQFAAVVTRLVKAVAVADGLELPEADDLFDPIVL